MPLNPISFSNLRDRNRPSYRISISVSLPRKPSFQWAYEPFRKSRFPPLYACKNAPWPSINPRKITTYPFNNPQSFRGAMRRFCAQSGLPLRSVQGRRSMATDQLPSCKVAGVAVPSCI
jgi:hypothetical protein